MNAHLGQPMEHPHEPASNAVRRRAAAVEPATLRTYTPSQAVIARSQGCFHWTPEGRRLADFTSGVLVANLGHNPPGWWRRVLDYLQLSPEVLQGGEGSSLPLTAYNAVTELEVRAAERLVASLRREPGGGRLEQVLWAASGSEAIQKALWAALDRHGPESIIVSTRHGFHGKKGLAGAVTGSEHDADRDPRVKFLSFPCRESSSLALRRQPLDLQPYRDELNALDRAYRGRIAALITEPYLGGGGSYHPRPEYLQLLENFCREQDAVFILDEVQSNFGRTGAMYAFSRYGIEPDVVVLGKGLGNGIPVDAAVGPAKLFAHMRYGEGSDTWSAHPLGCAAVLATLDAFESSDVLEHAGRLAQVIERQLERLAGLRLVAQVRGEGVVWGIECAAFAGQSAAEVAAHCVRACYLGDRQGRAIHLLGPLAECVIRVSPPLVMPLELAEEYFSVLFEVFSQVEAQLAAGAAPAHAERRSGQG
jgi:4-aminobutyrate aminotransferase-like enzyme